MKLRRTKHGGAKRGGVIDTWTQVTVPAEIADLLPPDARFRVTFEDDCLRFELVAARHAHEVERA